MRIYIHQHGELLWDARKEYGMKALYRRRQTGTVAQVGGAVGKKVGEEFLALALFKKTMLLLFCLKAHKKKE